MASKTFRSFTITLAALSEAAATAPAGCDLGRKRTRVDGPAAAATAVSYLTKITQKLE